MRLYDTLNKNQIKLNIDKNLYNDFVFVFAQTDGHRF